MVVKLQEVCMVNGVAPLSLLYRPLHAFHSQHIFQTSTRYIYIHIPTLLCLTLIKFLLPPPSSQSLPIPKMAEQGKKNGDNEKIINAVLKVDLSCNCIGCIRRIRKACFSCHGVSMVKEDAQSNKVSVSGIFDPVKLKDKLQSSIVKKVEILSPIPRKKDDQKDNQKDNKDSKPEQANKNKEPAVRTVVLKMAWHCQGCIHRIHKSISTYKGVERVQMDKAKELITVQTTADPKLIVESLQKRFKRAVQILPEKKEKEEKENQRQNQKQEGGKKKDGLGEVEKEKAIMKVDEYFMVSSEYGSKEASSDYVLDVFYAPQLFSDDNPNGCSIM